MITTTDRTTCPSWCTDGPHVQHPSDDPGVVVHHTSAVSVQTMETATVDMYGSHYTSPLGDEPQTIWLDGSMLTPRQARHVAAELLRLADTVEP